MRSRGRARERLLMEELLASLKHTISIPGHSLKCHYRCLFMKWWHKQGWGVKDGVRPHESAMHSTSTGNACLIYKSTCGDQPIDKLVSYPYQIGLIIPFNQNQENGRVDWLGRNLNQQAWIEVRTTGAPPPTLQCHNIKNLGQFEILRCNAN